VYQDRFRVVLCWSGGSGQVQVRLIAGRGGGEVIAKGWRAAWVLGKEHIAGIGEVGM